MRKLTPKDYDESEFTELIRGKERINADIENIAKQFEVFNANKQKLENIIQFYKKPPKCQELNVLACDLYKLYDSTSENTEKIKTAVKLISSIKCPYCGIDTPSHIDHFLPRSKFPEFSIYTPNLIYVCSICNSKYKIDNVVNQSGERQFFNPYYDNFIETIQFLKCEVATNNSIYPSFKFYIDDSLLDTNEYAYKIIKNHFESMNLKVRYMEQISKEKFRQFKNRYVDLKERIYYGTTLGEIKRDIEHELRGYQEVNPNDWNKVFWESLKNSDDCLNLIVNKQIPI